MNKRKINRKNNIGYLHTLFCDVRTARMRMGNVDKEDEQLNPFQRRSNSQQITYKKLSKDTIEKKNPIDQWRDRIIEARKIAELIHLQGESRWNDSDPVYYILSTKWLNKLKDYIWYDYIFNQITQSIKNKTPLLISVNKILSAANRHPGPINNTDILMNETEFFPDWNDPTSYLNTPLRRNIGKEDFIIVNKYLWTYLKSEYGLYYSTLQVTGALNICQEEEYERQEIRRFTYFTADRKNIRRVHLPMIKVYIARRGKKLEDTGKYLILKQRAKWSDVKKRIVKIIPSCLNYDHKQAMKLWILNQHYTTLEAFTDYYNSSILRGDVTDDFTIPAYCLESYGSKLVEHTVKIDDPTEIPIIILELKNQADLIWQFKQNSHQNKIKFITTGKELGREYMINENSDSDSDDDKERQNLSSKFAQGDSKTVHGDFKIYFQQTFCTKEFYDMETIDKGIFQLVEEMEANKARKILERKEYKAKQAELAKKKKQEEIEKPEKESTIEHDDTKETNIDVQKAKDSGKNITWGFWCKNDPDKIMLWWQEWKEVFYCDSDCMNLDNRHHTKICSKKYADVSFALETDHFQLSREEEPKNDMEVEPNNDKIKEENSDIEEITDSEEAESTRPSPRKLIKTEKEPKVELKEESSQEEIIQGK